MHSVYAGYSAEKIGVQQSVQAKAFLRHAPCNQFTIFRHAPAYILNAPASLHENAAPIHRTNI